MPKYFVGTAGWSYEDWQGIVYPQAKPAGFQPLTYLAGFVNLVEINSTFYHPASPAMIMSWIKKVKTIAVFFFSLKLHQVFTHERKNYSQQDIDKYRQALDLLRLNGRLAALLIQFPWSFINNSENADYLKKLLNYFQEFPKAVEVRHSSWDKPVFYQTLRENQAAFCIIDQPLFKNSIKPSSLTTSQAYSYVRLHGRNYSNWFKEGAGRDERYDYLYSRQELEEWVERIKTLGNKTSSVFVVTNNHYRGQALANALQIKSMITGEKVDVPEELLQKYADLKEIVSRPLDGQHDLFKANIELHKKRAGE